jgi:hypothetical protein
MNTGEDMALSCAYRPLCNVPSGLRTFGNSPQLLSFPIKEAIRHLPTRGPEREEAFGRVRSAKSTEKRRFVFSSRDWTIWVPSPSILLRELANISSDAVHPAAPNVAKVSASSTGPRKDVRGGGR